jgi:hypothetical protein
MPARPHLSSSLKWIRGHWQIEVLRRARDVSCGEYASQIRTGSGPEVMASLYNLGIAILKMSGHSSIAAASCRHVRDATWALATLGISPPPGNRTTATSWSLLLTGVSSDKVGKSSYIWNFATSVTFSKNL